MRCRRWGRREKGIMSGRLRQIVGLCLLLAVAGSIFALQASGLNPWSPRPAPITVHGTIGSEKAGLLEDEAVKKLLREKYGITVDYRRTGSINLVTADPGSQDFLWPGSQYARDLYEQAHGASARSEVVFNSPIVLYGWAPVAEALMRRGIVSQDGDVRYVDLPALMELVNAGASWRDLGVDQLTGKVLVHTTDPSKSNSGLLFAGLLLNQSAGGVADEASLQRALPPLRTYYGRLGYMEESSGFLFDQFLVMGMGTYPLIVGYENQLVEYALEHEAQRDTLRREITILYPRSTVWSSHALLALTPNGGRLLDALRDPDLQQLAWTRHGFRSGLMGVQNDPAVLQLVGVSRTLVDAQPLPRAATMDALLAALRAK
jgi:hypothetical protein